jgi:transcriptional regulator of aromatic amino acid metabolism
MGSVSDSSEIGNGDSLPRVYFATLAAAEQAHHELRVEVHRLEGTRAKDHDHLVDLQVEHRRHREEMVERLKAMGVKVGALRQSVDDLANLFADVDVLKNEPTDG